jgi:hypothetical protein
MIRKSVQRFSEKMMLNPIRVIEFADEAILNHDG